MSFSASQYLTKMSTITTSTALATIGGYVPLASTAAAVYAFSVSNVATSNKRAYVDILYNDGAGNSAYFVRQMPIDPGAGKAVNAVSKHTITASGYISAAITSTSAGCAFIMTLAEVTN